MNAIDTMEITIDAVYLDDNPICRLEWRQKAIDKGINLVTCRESIELYKVLPRIGKDIPIYIDSHLNEEKKGIEIAKELEAMGFTNLYITKNNSVLFLEDGSFLRGVITDQPPF